jgi:hypothetical protein
MASRMQISSSVISFQSSGTQVVNFTADTSSAATPYTLTLPSKIGFNTVGVVRMLALDATGAVSFVDATTITASTATDLLGFNTFEPGAASTPYVFENATVGAPGIVDEVKAQLVSSPVDTVTNAFARVDNWIWNYIFAQPPAPTALLAGYGETTSGFSVAWVNPTQYSAAFLANPVPYITELDVSLTDGSGNHVSTYTTTVTADLPAGATPVQSATFTINTGSAFSGAAASGTFTDVNTSTAVVYALTQSMASLGKPPYTVAVSFKNYGQGAQNSLTFSGLQLQAAGSPNAPTAVTVAATGATVQFTGLTAPTQDENNITNHVGSPAISSYDYHYATATAHTAGHYNSTGEVATYPSTITTTGAAQPTPRRWYSAYVFADESGDVSTATVATSGTHVTAVSDNLDMPYALTVAANNIANATFANYSAPVYTRSGLPVAASFAGGLNTVGITTISNGTPYPHAGVPISSRASAVVTPYEAQSFTALSTAVGTGLMLNALAMPGVTTTYTAGWSPAVASRMSLILYSGGAAVLSSTYAFTGLDGAYTNTEVSTAGTAAVSLLPSLGRDATAGTTTMSTGFYATTSLQGKVYAAALAPSTAAYAMQFQQFLAGDKTYSSNVASFYVDDLQTASTVSSAVTISSVVGSQTAVCGVLSYNLATTVNANVDTTNLGRYFLASTMQSAVLTWNSGNVSAVSNYTAAATQLTDTSDVNQNDTTAIPVGTVRRVRVSATGSTGAPFTGGSLHLALSATSNSLLGSATFSANQFGGKYLYFDVPSVVKLGTFTRVTSGSDSGGGPDASGGVYPTGTLGTDYGTTWTESAVQLATTNTTELQLFDGYFAAKGFAAAPGYLNYGTFYGLAGPDYSGVTATAGTYRYVTFAFSTAGTGSGNSYLVLTISGGTGAGWGMNGTTYALNNVRMSVMMASADFAGGQSAWFNANLLNTGTNVNGAGVATITSNPMFPVLVTTGASIGTTATTRVLTVPSASGSSATTIYVRVGIDMSVDAGFTGITAAFA